MVNSIVKERNGGSKSTAKVSLEGSRRLEVQVVFAGLTNTQNKANTEDCSL